MKNIITILGLILISYSVSLSQLPNSYPYKSIVDNNGFIYMTGDTIYQDGSKDFVMKKYTPNGNPVWSFETFSPYFNDKGLDIVIDEVESFVYATGFITNSLDTQLVIVKRRKDNGILVWEKRYEDYDNYSSMGFGVATGLSGNVYVTGHVRNKFNEKDLMIINYDKDFGNILWEDRYSNIDQFGDDIGYDIMTDDNYVYVIGSAYNGADYKNDIVLLNYSLNGQNREVDLIRKGKTNDIPTGFIISGPPIHQNEKSRISVTSISENPEFNPSGIVRSEYLTMTFNGGSALDLEWMKTFSRESAGENVATSIDKDESGNVYVSGYSYSSRTGFDYATIKYNMSGNYGWVNNPVQYYDTGQAVDKGSSVKVNGNLVYVTGSSQLANGGFRTIQYEQDNNGNMHKVWQNDYKPNFSDEVPCNKAAQINIDLEGSITILMMQWGNSGNSQYAIVKYSEQGDVIFIFDCNDPVIDNQILNNTNSKKSGKENFNYTLSQNYPNPFNPVTLISYTIPSNVKREKSNVKLIVFDILGKETATLVNENQEAGSYSVKFDGSNFPSGVYYYKLTAGDFEEIKVMVLLK